ncbi:MAG: methanogenesis marker 6 protein [Methanomicrobiaceae archaeon]|nr:methanogenesis marker 6 protein [Methanomicrobiaceae archaeon]
MKEYSPKYVGTVTKYIFVDSPDVTPQLLALRAYEVSRGTMIKETCFGLQVTGSPEDVDRIIQHVRPLDRAHIFVKDRGFPPGDPRRCRANLGGARPGYYGHEFEIGLLKYVSRGLAKVEGEKYIKKPSPREKPVLVRPGLDIKVLKKLMEAEEQ